MSAASGPGEAKGMSSTTTASNADLEDRTMAPAPTAATATSAANAGASASPPAPSPAASAAPLSPASADKVFAEVQNRIAKANETIKVFQAQEEMAMERKRTLETRSRMLEVENEKLRATILQNALQNGDAELKREHLALRQTLESFQTKIDQMREISLLSAKVVDSRIKTKQGRQYVEYKLQIETDIRGTLVLWHRYSTFLNLAATLKAKNPNSQHEIPELQTQSLTGFFSDQLIVDRINKLNEFLDVVTKADEFQWGIRIDKDTCVYKRKSKRAAGDRSSSGGSRESISTLASGARDSISSYMTGRASTISIESL
ncbi:TPA: hypothetical protein N0F65_004529 [Lagenidium giganteum]|uniref:PX domain-containing protein n=1 Tax=Lagenidium giganteum TaxID=4803 RepID=A0AAV2YZV5_9STRA|nr:TPA: hypothetical protein N0F65_004529 [Lagenidium giganteum]